MKITILEEDNMYELCGVRHNPPLIQNQKDDNFFQAEIKALYEKLVTELSRFGEEGDNYGISDFAVRPCLKDFPSVTPRAEHIRMFTITILTEKFFRSEYLPVLQYFLASEAPGFRIQIDKDFDPEWIFRMFLTANLAQIYCTKPEELYRLTSILSEL